jgi:hypothetical protein
VRGELAQESPGQLSGQRQMQGSADVELCEACSKCNAM